jgi:hypothetical protein
VLQANQQFAARAEHTASVQRLLDQKKRFIAAVSCLHTQVIDTTSAHACALRHCDLQLGMHALPCAIADAYDELLLLLLLNVQTEQLYPAWQEQQVSLLHI